jgi:hypothetical protein
MGKKEEKMPSQTRQRQALQKKHIPTKGLSRQTTRRLYKYYIEKKHPASDPRAYAYGEQKRVERRIEKEGTLVAGTGEKISAKTYIKNIDKRTRRQTEKQLHGNVQDIKFTRRFKSGKREDSFRYMFDKKGLVVDGTNIKSILTYLEKTIIPDLMENVDVLYDKRGRFYAERTIGALIVYKTKNVPDDPVPRPVKFSTREDFKNYLLDMLYELLVVDILRHYKNAIIRLTHIDVFIRTRKTPSSVDRLL